MQLIIKHNKGIRFSLCVIDIFSKYAQVVPLKDKKDTITIANALQSILEISKGKPNKIQVDQGSEFCSNSFEKWLKDNGTELYLTYNEEKFDVAEYLLGLYKIRFTNI